MKKIFIIIGIFFFAQHLFSQSHKATSNLKPINKYSAGKLLKKQIEIKISSLLTNWLNQQIVNFNKAKSELEAWKNKGEFEKTADYNIRMQTQLPVKVKNLESMEDKINKELPFKKQEFTQEVLETYSNNYANTLNWRNYNKKGYNADDETMLLHINDQIGDIALKIPPSSAQQFSQNLNLSFKNYEFSLTENGWQLEKMDIVNNATGQSFSYNARNAPGYVAAKPVQYDLNLPNLALNTAGLNTVKVNTNSTIKTKGEIKVYDVDQNLPHCQPRSDRDIAIIIGNHDYKKIGNVDFAINDAQSVKNYFVEALNFNTNSVVLLINATKSEFDEWFGSSEATFKSSALYKKVREGSNVFIYYIGHGLPDPNNSQNAYFLPVDGNPQNIENTGYSLTLLNHNLSYIATEKKVLSLVLLTDACFSGAGVQQSGVSGFKTKPVEVAALDNGIFFASSTGNQFSGWYKAAGHGMFTYFFLKAIHNKNADKNKDNKLTYKELFDYISDKNEGVPYYSRNFSDAKNDQDPVVKTMNPAILNQVFINY